MFCNAPVVPLRGATCGHPFAFDADLWYYVAIGMFEEVDAVYAAYMILALFLIFYIGGIVKALRKKKRLEAWCLFAFLPFLIFAVTNVALGGSAFNSAETNYELYEAGRYYLHSHGVYTEVSYSCFMFMKVLEVVCIPTFAIGFVLAFISRVRSE